MQRTSTLRQFAWMACVCAGLALAWAPGADAADPPPAVSRDGLQLKVSNKHRAIYVKPGADLAAYKSVAILDCAVEFEKDWQKDYNDSRVGLEDRVDDKDVERMKAGLAAEFKKVFTKVLQDKGGYEVVATAAPDVLVLRPALLNVEVAAPDLMTAEIGATIVRSAGQMTLFLELWDSSTSTLLARIMDAEADDRPTAQVANRVTNTAAADRILTDWAVELRKHLDAAQGKATD